MSDDCGRCEDAILEANKLLEPPSGVERSMVRLRLARDELSTKVMKVESAEAAGRVAEQELVEAVDRLRQEIEVTRRASLREAENVRERRR